MVRPLFLGALIAYAGCVSAEPIRAVIGTRTGVMIVDASSKEHNRGLSNLAMSKDMQKGTVTINVHIRNNCPPCVFLVRLFDRNGNYLTHFQTQQLHKMFGANYQMGPRRMEFRVNMRDLRDAEMAEFGYVYPR